MFLSKSTVKFYIIHNTLHHQLKQASSTYFYKPLVHIFGFPRGSVIKNLSANAGDSGLIPGLGTSPGEGNVNPLQYSCLGNRMDKGAWWATVCGTAKESGMT